MVRTLRQVDTWINSHVQNHVLSGHTHALPTPTPTPPPVPVPPPVPTPPPVPVPVPPPVPTPPPAGRPFPAPVTPNVVVVPAGANVQQLVDAAPNGTEFRFTGAEHVMANGIYLRDRHHLVFTGNGSTIRCTSQAGNTASSGFKLDNLNSDIAIRNLTIKGSNPNTDTVYNTSGEMQMGVCIFDSQRIEVDNVRVRNVYGDMIYVAGKNSAPQRPSEDVWVHHSSGDYIGRMGVVPISVRRFLFQYNTLDHVGLFAFDIECDEDYEIVDDVKILDNTIGAYGQSGYATNWFFACAAALSSGSNAAKIGKIAIERNKVTGGARANGNNPARKGGLASIANKPNRIQGFVFRDNESTVPGDAAGGAHSNGAVLYLAHIDGLVVTGNKQPGTLASISDCPGAVVGSNS